MEDSIRTERMKLEVELITKEPVNVELIRDTYYVWGSELACLRLFHAYRKSVNVNFDYSENLKSFYFSITINN